MRNHNYNYDAIMLFSNADRATNLEELLLDAYEVISSAAVRSASSI